MNFIDSIFALRKAAFAPDTEESEFSAFSVSAKDWLAASSKPKMADDALTYRLLAEDAYKRKDFTAALEAYSDALSRHPMWPDGHYNTALLAAEAEDFELASRHMRRYLVLSPDAKDSASAKEKFLLWQHKANPGAPVRVKLGVLWDEISQEAREHFEIPASVNGLVIAEVLPGSRAADAGLLRGNDIVEVDRVAVSKYADAMAIIDKSEGDMLLRLWTKDGTRDVVVKERKDN